MGTSLTDPPLIDPTRNVMDLVLIHTKRLDDLRSAEARRMDDILRLRDTIRAAELERVTSEMALRTLHANEMAAKEKERLDAIREIDGNNLTAAVERAAVQAQQLAKAVELQADNRRLALSDLTSHMDARLGKIETFQNEIRGRQGLSTPLVAVLAAVVGAFLGFGIQFLFTSMTHFAK